MRTGSSRALEDVMVNPTEARNEVTVVFEDAALMFALPPDATFEDLAERVAGMAAHHLGGPVAIGVKLPH
jgi:hypothetical protein